MDFFISLLIIVGIALLLESRFGLNAAAGPLVSSAVITVTLMLFGIVGALRAGGFLLAAVGAFGYVYIFAIKKLKPRQAAGLIFTPATVFFIAACTAFFFVLMSKQASFRIWDEFSFWGIAIKSVFQHGQLYTMFESSMINVSYLPGLPLFSYFTMFFARDFCEWRAILGYDVLMMAVMTLLWSRVKWRRPVSVAVFAAFSLLGLYAFLHSFDGMHLYSNVYADVPLGVVFGGALMTWFCCEKDPPKTRYFSFLVSLSLLALIKDMGLALGLVAAGVAGADMLISGSYAFSLGEKRGRGVLKAAAQVLLPMAVTVLTYKLWSAHVASKLALDISAPPYQYGALDMLSGKDEFFNEILRRMAEALTVNQVIAFGTVAEMCAVLFALPLFAALLTWNKRKALRLGTVSALLTAGFFVYYFFLAYLYAAVFYHTPEYSLISYGRYVASYCIGWFIAVVGVFTCEVGKAKYEKLYLLPACGVMALSLITTRYFTPIHPDQYVLISPKIDLRVAGVREYIKTITSRYRGCFDVSDRVYCVCQESDGGEWFEFNYEFQPAYTVPTFGGGNFVGSEEEAATAQYGVYARRENFAEYLREQQVDYVFLYKINDYFRSEFSPMFTDNMEYTIDGSVRLYHVSDGAEGMSFEPVINREQLLAWKSGKSSINA